MENNFERFIWVAVCITLFILSATAALISLNDQDRTLQIFKESNMQEDRRLFISIETNDELTYSGAEVMQSIRQIQNLDVNIEVENRIFTKDLDIETAPLSIIQMQKKYEVSYIRDVDGKVQTILFR